MNPIRVVVLAALLVSIERASSQTGFSYDRQDLWPDNCNVPTAMRQTPIDIITRDVQRNSSLIELEFNDVWTATLNGTFLNGGLTPRFVASTGGTATVRNHLGSYDLLNFHLHWGRENDRGTGHRINGEEFGLEFHFVTALQGESLVNLSNTSRGDLISVISVLAEVDDTAEISGVWEKLNVSAIIGAGNSTAVTGLSYPSVLPENRDYYYYPGSQTSPPCYEFVQWFVLQNRIKVPRPFLEQLRTLRNFNDEPITLNNRDAQPLNGRIVSVLPSSEALDLVFINDTPQVDGSGILHAEFATNTPGTDVLLTCHLVGPTDNIAQDCADGSITFTGLEVGDYTLRVIAIDIVSGGRAVIRSQVWISGDNEFCAVYAINRRVTVFGNSATIEFSNTGNPTSFRCRLDRQLYVTCSSPVMLTDLDPGTHRLRIRPVGCGRAGEGHRSLSVKFFV